MTKKTIKDCAGCPVHMICTAHITGGTWPYDKGMDPCEVEIGECG